MSDQYQAKRACSSDQARKTEQGLLKDASMQQARNSLILN